MRVLLLLAALLFGLPSFAASRCDVNVPTQTVDLEKVSIAYQSIGRASDPALLLVMGLSGQLIHWPDEVVAALCELGLRAIRCDNRNVDLSTWRQAPASANLTVEVLRYKLGLDLTRAAEILASDEYAADVREQEQLWISCGVTSVPTIVFNDQYAVSGCQPADWHRIHPLQHSKMQAFCAPPTISPAHALRTQC